MEVYPTKLQTICIGKKEHENITSFEIDYGEINCENNVTLFGINIDFMLGFGDHVANICKEASKQLAFLKRLVKDS